jgi:PhoH-like ATPase
VAAVDRTTGGTRQGSIRDASGKTPPPNPPSRTYVLDTSVLLADPCALRRFTEHEIVLPVVVITVL